MKKCFLFIFLASTIASVIAQAPNALNYQAVVRNEDGTVKANESINLEVEIIADSIDGKIVYSESHEAESNELGLVTIKIGEGFTDQSFDSIDWADGPYFLGILVNGVKLGASQILSVPYALYADEAQNINSLYYEFGIIVFRISGKTEYGFEFDEEFTSNYSEVLRPSHYYENQNYPGAIDFKILATEGTSGNKIYLEIRKDQYSYDIGNIVVLFNKQYEDNSVFSINVKFTSFEEEIINIHSFNETTGKFKGSVQTNVISSDFQSLSISCEFDINLKMGLSDVEFLPYQF